MKICGVVDRTMFKSFVKIDDNGCWIWQRSTTNGYGQLRLKQFKTARANRIAWILWRGDPGNLHVLHKCDVPACCNPRHMFLGTDKDNMHDAIRKGRANIAPAHEAVSLCWQDEEFTKAQKAERSARYAVPGYADKCAALIKKGFAERRKQRPPITCVRCKCVVREPDKRRKYCGPCSKIMTGKVGISGESQ